MIDMFDVWYNKKEDKIYLVERNPFWKKIEFPTSGLVRYAFEDLHNKHSIHLGVL